MTRKVPWEPTATRRALAGRAAMYARIREFFARRGVLEVDTPVLGRHAVTDPHIDCIPVTGPSGPGEMFLQSSPEYAMKRLLAAGSGPVYQIAHAFRRGERGRLHNPEFTLLEWYRPGFDHHRLMDEVTELLAALLPRQSETRLNYAEVFHRSLGIDPFHDSVEALCACARARITDPPELGDDRDAWLDLLMGAVVAPSLGHDGPVFVYDYPASQAALARLSPQDPTRAERFELFLGGWEIANGFHELGDAVEQRARFRRDRELRARNGMPVPEVDERLLDALNAGLPDCAGVAVGLDRLLMLMLGANRIDEVIAFPLERS